MIEKEVLDMKVEREKGEGKLVYEKPRLRVIELLAGEVLAVGCKLYGSGIASGVEPCWLNNCTSVGT